MNQLIKADVLYACPRVPGNVPGWPSTQSHLRRVSVGTGAGEELEEVLEEDAEVALGAGRDPPALARRVVRLGA